MLTADQKAHFDTFGFLTLKQAATAGQLAEVTAEMDSMLEKDREGRPFAEEGQAMSPFVDQSAVLTRFVDDLIAEVAADLIGPEFIWASSEGNVTVHGTHGWHADRTSESDDELAYIRLKINMYLDPVTVDAGALRVIPGSHQRGFHRVLEPLESMHHEKGRTDPTATPYGVLGTDMPYFAFESEPGDLICFNQALFHSVFNGFAGRRYIAFKFATGPTSDVHYKVIKETMSLDSDLDPAIAGGDLPRIRGLAERTAAAATRVGA